MDTLKLKLVTMGPQRCGKTRVANYVAQFDETPNLDVYNPTCGVRILEFEKNVRGAGGRSIQVKAELWDCSGDKKYENCWPAILRGASGVLLVYDPTIKTQEKDIEMWHKAFVKPLNLKDEQVALLAHQHESVGAKKWTAPRTFDGKVLFASTTLDSDEGMASLRSTFETFLGSVAKAVSEKSKADLEASMLSAMDR
mmetsp:Transcript_13193/g.28084  ORF Transcript_13193/g.28084 Transcript_13193/m.28084 type:complete len:197 (-) Transcript_13193:344-934(-)